jgi:hypothetical protein
VPKYFFHVDGPRPHVDGIGTILSNDHAAWLKARRTIQGIEDNLEPGESWSLEVKREGGEPTFLFAMTSRRFAKD